MSPLANMRAAITQPFLPSSKQDGISSPLSIAAALKQVTAGMYRLTEDTVTHEGVQD